MINNNKKVNLRDSLICTRRIHSFFLFKFIIKISQLRKKHRMGNVHWQCTVRFLWTNLPNCHVQISSILKKCINRISSPFANSNSEWLHSSDFLIWNFLWIVYNPRPVEEISRLSISSSVFINVCKANAHRKIHNILDRLKWAAYPPVSLQPRSDLFCVRVRNTECRHNQLTNLYFNQR